MSVSVSDADLPLVPAACVLPVLVSATHACKKGSSNLAQDIQDKKVRSCPCCHHAHRLLEGMRECEALGNLGRHLNGLGVLSKAFTLGAHISPQQKGVSPTRRRCLFA